MKMDVLLGAEETPSDAGMAATGMIEKEVLEGSKVEARWLRCMIWHDGDPELRLDFMERMKAS